MGRDAHRRDSVTMSQEDRTVLGWGAFVLAAAALFVAVFAVMRDDGSSAAAPSAPSTAAPTIVEVRLSEFTFSPAALTVPPGPVTVRVVNIGAAEHNYVVPGLNARTPNLRPGESYDLDLGTLSEGTYDTLCDIPGHAAAGMVGTLSVRAGSAPSEPGTGHANETWQEIDYRMEERNKSFPAATEGKGGQPFVPETLPDGTKLFKITTSYVDWEVEPGKVVRAMAYNGTVPGPEIRVDVGDKVRVELTNELDQSTALHFHGVRVPNLFDGVSPYTQPVIAPGETFTYEFTTLEAGVGIYHSHHMAEIQIPDGLFGAFLVGQMPIPQALVDKGWPSEPDHEITMVLNDAGAIGMSLNGKSFPATEPYTMAVGEVLMVHYQNEGLMGHPMHLHQPIGWVVAKDGVPLEVPMPTDTVWVSPGERYTVAYMPGDDQIGVWAWHCHILTHAEGPDGFWGMVTALIVTP